MVICSLMNFGFLTINLRLIYPLPLQILFTRAPPLVVVVVDAVALILREVGGVANLNSRLLPIALSAKCATSLGMWPWNVITGLTTLISLIILLRCRLF